MTVIVTVKTKNRLHKLITFLQQGLVERDEATRLALLAALSGEHLLLIGPPGTAKSQLARRLKLVCREGSYFERLLTKFSVPEELFGPLSIKALEEDRYERITHRYLPNASIAFIDEIFKANSAILNSLLTLLNEREFDNGNRRIQTPLISVIGASNELPEGDELNALYDRFLIRYHVNSVSEQGFQSLLALDDCSTSTIEENLQLSVEDIHSIQEQARKIPLSKDAQYLINELRKHVLQQSIYISDRRWRKLVKLLQVAAYTNAKPEVGVWDCWLLQHCLWHEPQQRLQLFDWYQSQLGTDAAVNPQRLERLTATWQHTLDEESHRTRQLRNMDNEPLYKDHTGKTTSQSGYKYQAARDGALLYLAPPDQMDRTNQNNGYTRAELQKNFFDDHYQQCHIHGKWVSIDEYTGDVENQLMRFDAYQPLTELHRYSPKHVQDREVEIQSLLDDITQYKIDVNRNIGDLSEDVGNHLWINKGFSVTAKENLQHGLNDVIVLARRLETIRKGFSQLPQQE